MHKSLESAEQERGAQFEQWQEISLTIVRNLNGFGIDADQNPRIYNFIAGLISPRPVMQRCPAEDKRLLKQYYETLYRYSSRKRHKLLQEPILQTIFRWFIDS